MTKLQVIREFATEVWGSRVVIGRERKYWAMDSSDSYPRLILPVNIEENDVMDKAFRRNFIARCPLAKGFSNVTLSILHELGHYARRDMIDLEYFALCDNIQGEAYFDLPAEFEATNWAIEWLQDAKHRSMAKAFERKYAKVRHT
jgi:hypothetical protein